MQSTRRLRTACRLAVAAGEVALWAVAFTFLVLVSLHAFALGLIGLSAIWFHGLGLFMH
jgi:hypothetical protein